MRQMLAWAMVVMAVGWGTSIAAAPMMRGTPRVTAATYLAGALVCHQKPERSFHVGGMQLPVCARCAALYWGGALGLAAWLLVRPRRGLAGRARFARATFILGLPIAITLLTSATGVWDPGNALRAIVSAPFGVALGALVAAVAVGDLR